MFVLVPDIRPSQHDDESEEDGHGKTSALFRPFRGPDVTLIGRHGIEKVMRQFYETDRRGKIGQIQSRREIS